MTSCLWIYISANILLTVGKSIISVYHAVTKCIVVRHLYSLCCQNAMLITMLRSDKDEPHQEHRLGTVSKKIITGGLKPVLRDPNPRPRFKHTVFRRCLVISNNGFRSYSHTWCGPNLFRVHIPSTISYIPQNSLLQAWKTLWFSRLTL